MQDHATTRKDAGEPATSPAGEEGTGMSITITGNVDARHERVFEQLTTACLLADLHWKNYTVALRLGLIPAGRFPDEPKPHGQSAA